MMEEIVVTEDDLRRLEKRFGSAVRLMGSWNSDGTFGYASVPLSAVRRAAEDLVNPDVIATLSRPTTHAGAHHRVPRIVAYLRLPLDRGDRCSVSGMLPGKHEERSRGFNIGERSGTKTVGTNSGRVVRSHALSLRHLNDWRKPGAVAICELSDARTHLPVPFMPVLRHLPRQEVKFSGTDGLPIASKRWAPA